MSEMNFGRQLKPVTINITDGDEEDRFHWQRKIEGFLRHQPCVTVGGHNDTETFIIIHPDANND